MHTADVQLTDMSLRLQVLAAGMGSRNVGLRRSAPVPMNFWGFTPGVSSHREELLGRFFDSGAKENPKSEFYLPSVVSKIIASGAAPASVIPAKGRWFGLTSCEDREAVSSSLSELVKQGLYMTPLGWHTL